MSKHNPVELAKQVKEFVKADGVKVTIDRDKAVGKLCDVLEITEKEIKHAQENAALISASIATAYGEEAVEVLAANKDVAQLQESFKVGHEKSTVNFKRQAEYPNMSVPGEKIVKIGALSVNRTQTTGESHYKSAKEHLAAIAAQKLP